MIFEVGGALLVGVGALFYTGFQPQMHPKGVLFAILTGVAGMIGNLFYFSAASKGKISIVVSMTALYPLSTVIILAAVFFAGADYSETNIRGRFCVGGCFCFYGLMENKGILIIQLF